MSDEYDTPWKEMLLRYFPQFLAFYFPQAHAGIDCAVPYVFLDQELAKVTRDASNGKRLVDKPVQVGTPDGGQQWMYLHVEVRNGHEKDFAERIFVSNYRVYDRYRRPVASLALLAEESEAWSPSAFHYRLFGCEMGIRFPIVKLIVYRDRIDALLGNENPFALVTAAHLLTQQTRRHAVKRYAAKWRLSRLLYERGWTRQCIIDLFLLIDWMMRVPREFEDRLWHEIVELERKRKMAYMSSIERIGMERGYKQGHKKGHKEGQKEGRMDGVRQGQALLLERLIVKRFGSLPKEMHQRIAAADTSQLSMWGEAVLDTPTLDALLGPKPG